MVKEIEHKDKKFYQCEACNMYYEDKSLAKQCEKHCMEKHACNTQIIKHAVDTRKENKGGYC